MVVVVGNGEKGSGEYSACSAMRRNWPVGHWAQLSSCGVVLVGGALRSCLPRIALDLPLKAMDFTPSLSEKYKACLYELFRASSLVVKLNAATV